MKVSTAWIGFFTIWFCLLTGVLDFWFHSPGLKQWYKVDATLKGCRQEIVAIESKIDLMREVTKQLESNAVAQEREIRRVLGYLGEHEVVFEFSH